MLNLDTEAVSKLLEEVSTVGGDSEDTTYLAAKHFEEQVLISGYCLSFALCRATKPASQRRNEVLLFGQFVSESFVELCSFDEEFVQFMLSHVRDGSVTLPDQIRELFEKKLSFDYKDALRT